MSTQKTQTVQQVFDQWQTEDRDLEKCVDEVRAWMREVNQLGIPHFGETATRLGPLRARLVEHFQREEQMISRLGEVDLSPSPELEGMQRQASQDHDQLMQKIDGLMGRLNELDPPFRSWQAAMDELERFVDSLEQHEGQELESFLAFVKVADADRATKNLPTTR